MRPFPGYHLVQFGNSGSSSIHGEDCVRSSEGICRTGTARWGDCKCRWLVAVWRGISSIPDRWLTFRRALVHSHNSQVRICRCCPSCCRGKIKFDSSKFTPKPHDYFHYQLDDLTASATRDKQAVSRLLIGHYLCHALKLSRDLFQMPRLVFHSEVDIELRDVGELGWLGHPRLYSLKNHGRV